MVDPRGASRGTRHSEKHKKTYTWFPGSICFPVLVTEVGCSLICLLISLPPLFTKELAFVPATFTTLVSEYNITLLCSIYPALFCLVLPCRSPEQSQPLSLFSYIFPSFTSPVIGITVLQLRKWHLILMYPRLLEASPTTSTESSSGLPPLQNQVQTVWCRSSHTHHPSALLKAIRWTRTSICHDH